MTAFLLPVAAASFFAFMFVLSATVLSSRISRSEKKD